MRENVSNENWRHNKPAITEMNKIRHITVISDQNAGIRVLCTFNTRKYGYIKELNLQNIRNSRQLYKIIYSITARLLLEL